MSSLLLVADNSTFNYLSGILGSNLATSVADDLSTKGVDERLETLSEESNYLPALVFHLPVLMDVKITYWVSQPADLLAGSEVVFEPPPEYSA